MAGMADVTRQFQRLDTGRPQSAVPCYKMDALPRGQCVIINNKTFNGDPSSPSVVLETRNGTDVDRDKLVSTFERLHFTVQTHDDLTDTEMLHVIKGMAVLDHSKYDCFVCCIMTHGNLGVVYGVNGVPVKIRDLTKELRPQSCPTLTDKPKLFFVQACQGGQVQRGYPPLQTDATNLEEQKLIPNEADFLLAYSTVPGFVSYRDATQGSWFIGKLTELLNKHAYDQSILDILTLMKHEVGKMGAARAKQAPATLTSLRKNVFFLPSTLRVLLLGRTGSGKSHLGNTLLGREVFRVHPSLSSSTDPCAREEGIRGYIHLQVTDTQGVFHTHGPEGEVKREILKGFHLTAPGPHVILIALRCDNRFTEEEYQAYESLKALFGPGMCDHMILIFNGMDKYEDSTLEERREATGKWVRESRPNLQKVLNDADGRYMGMDNVASPDIRERQAQDLIAMMLDLVKKNRGGYFPVEQNRTDDETCSVM